MQVGELLAYQRVAFSSSTAIVGYIPGRGCVHEGLSDLCCGSLSPVMVL